MSMHNVAVVVPYRDDGGWRADAWTQVVRPAWEALAAREHCKLIVAEAPPGDHPGEFNHPLAINSGAERAPVECEYLIVADADCAWTAGLPEALVQTVRYGGPWALPEHYTKLTRTQTRRVLRGTTQPVAALAANAEWSGRRASWAGLVCVGVDDFWELGGYDERYTYWGADDMAFGLAADTLLGAHERVEGHVIHLWHPTPLAHNYGHKRHRVQYDLGERYKAAVGDPAAMRAVRFDGRLGR